MIIAQGALAKSGRENRKSITADDLVWALKLSSEFCHYAPIARAYTQRHRAIEATSRLSKRQGLSRSPLARMVLLLMWSGSAAFGCLTNSCLHGSGDQSLNFNPTLPIFAAAPDLTSGSAMPEHLQTSTVHADCLVASCNVCCLCCAFLLKSLLPAAGKNASAIRSAARAYANVQARGKTRMPFARENSGAASHRERTAIPEANARPEKGLAGTASRGLDCLR